MYLMVNPASPDLLGHLGSLLNGSMSVAQFWRWLAAANDAIEASGSDAEVELVRVLDLRIAEYSSGRICEERLLQAIRREVAERNRAVPRGGDTFPGSPKMASLI